MKTSIILNTALVILSCAMASQAQCALKPGQSPEIRGIRLGMTTTQLLARYPRLQIGPADDFGRIKVDLRDTYKVDESAFKGVNSIFINLIDNRVYDYTVTYSPLPWSNVDQFVTELIKDLRLPAVGWQRHGDYTKSLDCDGFAVWAGLTGGSPYNWGSFVTVKSAGADEIIEKRMAEKRAQQLQSFRP